MFDGKARSLPLEWSPVKGFAAALPANIRLGVEVTCSEKHSSLIKNEINYKKFYGSDPS